jgi:diaminopimelate epimerase
VRARALLSGKTSVLGSYCSAWRLAAEKADLKVDCKADLLVVTKVVPTDVQRVLTSADPRAALLVALMVASTDGLLDIHAVVLKAYARDALAAVTWDALEAVLSVDSMDAPWAGKLAFSKVDLTGGMLVETWDRFEDATRVCETAATTAEIRAVRLGRQMVASMACLRAVWMACKLDVY